uniref:5-hydroxytryptamine receptor 3A n=1 Tax=Dicentrarchus labrax TaxID=13489 RepID=A0A8C4GHR3_DICLA
MDKDLTSDIMISKDTTLKPLPPTVRLVMFLILIPALCSAIEVNCSEPTQPALLEALTPIFNMSAIRPVVNMTTRTNVSTFFTLYGILGVDEKSQLLITYLWLDYWWKNELVFWDPNQCGTDKISLPRDKFWVPDIVINEFMDENTAPPVPYVYLYSNGMVHDAQPVKVVSSCNLDIYTFPFDIQNCTFTFNSYIHLAMDIMIFLGKSAENITKKSKNVMTTMGEWELLDITSHKDKYGHDDGQYIDELSFHIRVRRRATLYVVNLLIPSCFLITVDLFSFLLPPQTVDRSSFKMTLILGYTVFLLIMNDLLPITGNTIPLINVFFSLCLALMVTSLLETIFITNLLSGSADFSPLPRWVRVFVLQFLGCLVCLPQKTKEPKGSDIKFSTAMAQRKADEGPPGEMMLVAEGKAVQELRSLGRDLQAIRLQVEQQLCGSKSSKEWIQCCLLKVKPSKVLFIFISVLMYASCSSIMLNCSQPDPPSLLDALRPVFTLSSIRPVMNMSTPTNVSIDFILFGILGVDEKAQLLTTYIWQKLEWRNDFIGWDPDQCGSSRITIPRKLLWVPDVVINEFMEKNSAPFVPYSYVYSDGLVQDEQPVKVVSSCRLDIYTFPFDVQNCSLSFNSYLHRMAAMQIFPTIPVEEILKFSQEVMATMGEWELIGLSVKKLQLPASDGEPYEELRFFVTVRRRATLYVVNLLIPSCFLITVDLLSFLLPPKSIDRSLFKMTLILGYTVFLLIMNDLLPITGETIPLMNVFLSLCLGMMVASLLETILITNLLCGSAHYPPIPRWVRLFVLHFLGRLVGLPQKPRDLEDTVFQNPAAQDIKVSFLVAEDNQAPGPKGPLDEDKALQELRSLGKDLQALHNQLKKQTSGSQSSEEWIQ